MKARQMLDKLAHFDRCLFPDDFYRYLILKGLDPWEANAIKAWMIHQGHPVSIVQIYQEFALTPMPQEYSEQMRNLLASIVQEFMDNPFNRC